MCTFSLRFVFLTFLPAVKMGATLVQCSVQIFFLPATFGRQVNQRHLTVSVYLDHY